jgi:hypothetical protein
MRFISLSLLFAFALTGCFPHNAKHRKIAKWTEGATMVAGVLVLSQAKTGADCTAGPAGRDAYDDCRFKATIVGGVGLGMVLAGLVGFGVTQITSGDGREQAKPLAPLASEDKTVDPDAPKPQLPSASLKKR